MLVDRHTMEKMNKRRAYALLSDPHWADEMREFGVEWTRCEDTIAAVQYLLTLVCEHAWVEYSRPPMRAVTGRRCTKCQLIQE
jgi:hypothetical protein